MTPTAIAYGITASLTVSTGLGVWLSGRPVVSGYLLFATMASIAALFWELGSPTLAGLQLLVYGGGVLVMVLFVVMFTDSGVLRPPVEGPIRVLWLIVPIAGWIAAISYPSRGTRISGEQLGQWLLMRQGLSLESVALLLLTALVAAIAIIGGTAQRGQGDND